ncbi:UDP-N-acetylhexosamine pyrophosphorylase-like protein 1 [Aethina tumida]|uniref:UDP-N-acetylhexosamine pyrophosphorylase-like protein 1 n=1 Tax=Aethina tumida TaxID=116153 RepID=UPI0021488BD5|nr:UDP-N-acetylhexosamine pyrophosphorylase-like protein 1 [Aethina tumida]
MRPKIEEIQQLLEEYNQTHILKYWNELDNKDKKDFLNSLSEISFGSINSMFTAALNSLKVDVKQLNDFINPIPHDQIEVANNVSKDVLQKYRQCAYKEISENKIGVLLLAGGQGTRLGVKYPKGMFSVGLPSKKTLFQLQAERIRKVLEMSYSETKKHGNIYWYIMTSEATNDITEQYLKKNQYFGLKEENIIIFQQGYLPCLDNDGKIILNGKNSIAMAPDGNGGLFKALHRNGILNDFEKRGVKYVHVYGVDNILVKVADPAFLGYCISKNADCGAKVIKKTHPEEPVGVICKVDEHIKVVEYSEIDPKLASLRNELGDLVFSAGNICNHFFTTDFLRKVALEHENDLPLHVALKKIPYFCDGKLIEPTQPNGIKIEKFVFDVFPFSENFVSWEVDCASEFSPVKNKEGKDSPETARNDLLKLHKKYVEQAGGVCKGDVEISPLVSYAGENLRDYVLNRELDDLTVLDSKEVVCTNRYIS